jgi:beta-phosphoglucomutase-like phosphatase (HAD superfamily)
LRQAEIEGSFKLVVAAEDVERSKPAPEGYLRALQELNSRPPLPERLIHPHEVLAIEDTAAGLRAASDAGLVTLAVAHTAPAAELAGADLVIDRLAEVDLGLLQERFSEVSRR